MSRLGVRPYAERRSDERERLFFAPASEAERRASLERVLGWSGGVSARTKPSKKRRCRPIYLPARKGRVH